MRHGTWLTAGVLLAASAGALAHIRLIHPSNGNPLWWSNPAAISVVINSAGSDDIPDKSHETALRMAIDEWNQATGTTVFLAENTDPIQQARVDWAADDIHLIWFDETDASGYFPGFSGTVAVTPLWFQSNGRIVDADIIYNGNDHGFTTSGVPFRFDVGDIGTHELGHLIGLDHSGWAGATMYPYVDPTVILHRSISEDEVTGMRQMYPSVTYGRIAGTVERLSDSSAVRGALVVARDQDGRTRASLLTDSSGDFILSGLTPGTYDVYATPLDQPVSAADLGTGHVVQTDFEPGYYGIQAFLVGTETVAMGTLLVDADENVNLGNTFNDFPIRITSGTTTPISIFGGELSGATVTVSDPDMLVTPISTFPGSISFQVGVGAAEARGHIDVEVVTPSGDRAILPAALEITPPAPTVTNVVPSMGTTQGGTPITITGTDFSAGARVVIGEHVYADNDGSLTVVSSTTITLTTLPTDTGTYDVVAFDASGIEGRLVSGFDFAAIPVLSTFFPPAGNTAGGTAVTITGDNFLPGVVVRIDGVTQTSVTLESVNELVVTTEPYGVGSYGIEVENTDGGQALIAAYLYAAQPDPLLSLVTPPSGTAAGGDMVTLTGANFTGAAQVFFGADPSTGLGGTAAAGVTLIDPTTLEVETPAHGGGIVSVVVRDAGTGQAFLLPDAFTFSSGGGGGGGCSTVPFVPPTTPRGILLGSWWLALTALWLIWRARGPRGTRDVVPG